MLRDQDLGTVMTVAEFEKEAEAEGLVTDLLDRDDIDFTTRAIQRVNSSQHPGGHKWIRRGDTVTLIRGDFHQPLTNLMAHSWKARKDLEVLDAAIADLLQGAVQ